MGFELTFGSQSILGKLGMLIGLAPLGVAIIYAVRPTEGRLALMRPLTLATIFAGLCTFVAGVANILAAVSTAGNMSDAEWQQVALGAAETLVPLIVAFGCLTVSDLLIAVGLRRG